MEIDEGKISYRRRRQLVVEDVQIAWTLKLMLVSRIFSVLE